MAGAWIGRVLGYYGAGESVGFIMAVIGAVTVLGVHHVVTSRR